MGQVEGPAHADHVLKVIAGNDAASSALAASWRRSGALHALDPASHAPSQRLPEDEIAQIARTDGLVALRRARRASIASFSLSAASVVRSCWLTRAGSSSTGAARLATIRLFDGSGLWTGGVWSEQYEGTNGIGTCIVDQRAVTIDRDQHFFTRNSGLFCTTAPIFDEHGDLAAALDVSSCPGRPDRRLRAPDRQRGRRRGPVHRSGELPPRLSQGAHPARANRRPVRVVAARGRPRRPRDRRDAGGADRARRQLGHAQAPDPGRRPHGARREPKATTSTRRSAPSFNARSRARAATCPGRRRTSTCRERRSTGR